MPRVFLSSTCEDLKPEYRSAAEAGAKRAGFDVAMQEYWVATGGPPVDECLRKVADSDLVVAVVAYWYGWKPPGYGGKSITRVECEHARSLSKTVIPFLVDPNYAWPGKEEQDRLKERPRPTDVAESLDGLDEFKKDLKQSLCEFFTTPEDLRGKVESALREWRTRTGLHDHAAEPAEYLRYVRDFTSTIAIKGLGATARKANSVPIDEIFVPLMTAAEGRPAAGAETPKRVSLEAALRHRLLVIAGLPGSGKTTFLRYLAHRMAEARLAAAEPEKLPFPLMIRVGELVQHIRACERKKERPGPSTAESGEWLIHVLETRTAGTGLAPLLKAGTAVFLLDGLDEAPDLQERARVARVVEDATRRYGNCRFVVTTRPQSYTGAALLEKFHTAQIEPLDDDGIGDFLTRWARALFPESPGEADNVRQELSRALYSRPEIAAMASNPLMLTALAVIHWNEARLPEQRDKLYEAILFWLSRSREREQERVKPERCLELLQDLAPSMHCAPRGRQTQVEVGMAADALAPKFLEVPAADRRNRAIQFLLEEEADSGIITSTGELLRFWHLTFQEYLVARVIGGWTEDEQRRVLLDKGHLYQSEWREAARLFGGVLRAQGRKRSTTSFPPCSTARR